MINSRGIYLFIGAVLLLASCQKKQEVETIVLPPVSALSMEANWGVVISNYLRLRELPSQDAAQLTGLTKGMVVEILSTSGKVEVLEDKTAPWLSVSMDGFRGWVFGAYIKSFTSRSAAEAYARELK